MQVSWIISWWLFDTFLSKFHFWFKVELKTDYGSGCRCIETVNAWLFYMIISGVECSKNSQNNDTFSAFIYPFRCMFKIRLWSFWFTQSQKKLKENLDGNKKQPQIDSGKTERLWKRLIEKKILYIQMKFWGSQLKFMFSFNTRTTWT